MSAPVKPTDTNKQTANETASTSNTQTAYETTSGS